MISAFGVDHGGISKALTPEKQKRQDKQLAALTGATGAGVTLHEGVKRGVKSANLAIDTHNATQPNKVHPTQARAFRTGAGIGGAMRKAPLAAGVAGVAGGGFYGIQRAIHRKRT